MAKLKKSRIGEIRKMSNGMDAEIIAYRGNKNIDVKFSDGFIHKHVAYRAFCNGNVSNPNKPFGYIRYDHEGESKLMNCGHVATIIAYRLYNDIDIQFEDGTIVRNRTYQQFSAGRIRKPRKNRL